MKFTLIDKPLRKKISIKRGEDVGVVLVVGKPGDYEVRVDLMGEGARVCLFGLMNIDKGKYKILTETVHKHKNTHAETVFHGVVKGTAQTEVEGMIKIDEGSHQVTDFLTEKLLLLGDQARAVVEPSLEIKADDVRASHAATVSKIDEEQLFYLMSRGLTRKEAERVIEKGFMDTVVDLIKNVKIKKQVREKLNV